MRRYVAYLDENRNSPATVNCVINQKNAVLSYFAAET
jgi:hypothetical protein